MFSRLLTRFKKLSIELRIVLIFVIVISLWMLSFIFKGKEDLSIINKISVNYQISQSTAIHKAKILSFTGIAKAEEQINLIAELDGKVISILAKKGSFLKKGQGIIQIDPKNYLQNYNSAKENVVNQEILYNAALELKKKGLGSNAAVANAKAQFYSANAALKQAKLNLDNSLIKAPYDGTVDEISAKMGGYLAAGSQVGKFLSNKLIKIKFNVPDSKFHQVKNSTSVSLLLDGKEVSIDKISSLSCIADDTTKTYVAEVVTDNTQLGLKSGQVVKVLVNAGDFLAHKVNQSTINIDINGNVGVKVVNSSDVVEFVPVEIIGEDSDGFWIMNLPKSAKIIILGHTYIKPGEKLQSQQK
jgi:multidrug efflux system membrane fusion protein